jgi:DNA mismatch endonuclease (patch repair protein)
MSAVRSKGNDSTELKFLKLLRVNKITGWRRNQSVFGRPDFLFKKEKIAVFVDGCFWHGCKKCRTIPKQNHLFWVKKIARNVERDGEVKRKLKREGWKVVRIWEHDLKKNSEKTIKKLSLSLFSNSRGNEDSRH